MSGFFEATIRPQQESEDLEMSTSTEKSQIMPIKTALFASPEQPSLLGNSTEASAASLDNPSTIASGPNYETNASTSLNQDFSYSKLDTKKSAPTTKSITRGGRRPAKARRNAISEKSGKSELIATMRVKKPATSRQKKWPYPIFRHYHRPGPFSAVARTANSLHWVPIRVKGWRPGTWKYKKFLSASAAASASNPPTASISESTSTSEPTIENLYADSSDHRPDQHRNIQDVMRIECILNDDTSPTIPPNDPSPKHSPSTPSTPPQAFGTNPITPSTYAASEESSLLATVTPDRVEQDREDKDVNSVRTQFARTGLQDGSMHNFSRADRQRYEDAVLEIVGDLELPFDYGTNFREF